MDAPWPPPPARSPRAIRWARCTIALRGDPPALALRGIALAQLGDLERARALLRRAARTFRPEQELARARCELAEADVALAMRDLDWPDETLESTRQALLRHGDLANAAHARLLHARRLLLLGRADDAAVAIAGWDQAPLPAAARAVHAWPPPASPCAACRPNPPGWRWPRPGPPRAHPASTRCRPRPTRFPVC